MDSTSIDGIEPGELIREIQVAIENAGLDTPEGQGGLALHSVTITLKCLVESKTGLKPKFKVPVVGWEIGGSVEITKDDVQTIEVCLTTPWAKVQPEPDGKLAGPGAIKEVLPRAIASIREMLDQCAYGSLKAKTAKVELQFDVTQDGSIELAVPSHSRKRALTNCILFELRPNQEEANAE
jgi:hypothetical protein